MSQRMLHGSGVLKATILVGEEELGQVSKSDDSTSLNISLCVSSVPWGAYKDQGKLRFRIETSTTPRSSPCHTSPAPLGISTQHKSRAASELWSPLYMSSSSPASVVSCRGDLHPNPNSMKPAVYMSSAPATSAGPCSGVGQRLLEGVALYSGVAASPSATAMPWGVTVDIKAASSKHGISHRYELLARSAGRSPGVKGI
jgi:hypothetical protein